MPVKFFLEFIQLFLHESFVGSLRAMNWFLSFWDDVCIDQHHVMFAESKKWCKSINEGVCEFVQKISCCPV